MHPTEQRNTRKYTETVSVSFRVFRGSAGRAGHDRPGQSFVVFVVFVFSPVPVQTQNDMRGPFVASPMYMDVDCPKCNVVTTHDVPARQAGRTDYPVECPLCHAKFELWLDPQWFMMA